MLETLTQAVLPFAKPFYLKVNALVVVLVLATVPLEVSVLPVGRPFRLDNKYIAFPMVREHVPVGLLAVFSIFLPLVGILASNFHNNGFRQVAAISVCGFLLSITATMFLIDCLKLIIGNHRPDFLARCMPKDGLPEHEWLFPKDACTNPNWGVVMEGCKSTPSGHSALSFAGLLFLSLVLKRAYGQRFPKFVYFTPLLLAAYVAATRIIDHKHHYVDIISGSIIGSLIAYLAYVFVVERPTRDEEHPISA